MADSYPPGITPTGFRLTRTLAGHRGVVTRIAWSPDGGRLVSGSSDKTVRIWNASPGVLERTLEGHSDTVHSVTWSPDGGRVASASSDKTVRLWNSATGKLEAVLEGHTDRVFSVAWTPDSRLLASASADNTIRLWDGHAGTLVSSHVGHYAGVNDLAWSPDGRRLASGSYDQWIRVWNVERQTIGWPELRWEGKGHSAFVTTLAWSPSGQRLVSASDDKTVQVWDADSYSNRPLLTLEGHAGRVTAVSFSADGQLLASKSSDGTVRVWRCDTWQPVVVLSEPHSSWWEAGLRFHPTDMALATLGEGDTVLRLWALDRDVLLGHPEAPDSLSAVHHTTAKIVLVGESGVGKTGLGWRLAHDAFKEHASTHGQQFWVLNALGSQRADGTLCEAVLWDLAGQPDYRLIHALFLDDADLALVVFDPTDGRNPLQGIEYWLKQLPSGPGGARQVILVAARTDRGTARLTDAEMDAFCSERGIAGGHVATSALTGDGVAALLARMTGHIDWDRKTATVTSTAFKIIKDHVMRLKEAEAGQVVGVLVSPDDLRARLDQLAAGVSFTRDEMMAAVGHLANYGYVRVLRTSTGEQRILLAPELLNNLAASFVLEARRNARSLGSLEEGRLLAGGYGFRELTGLPPEQRTILLDAVALLFLEHHICFRETDPLTGTSYLVFPELINLRKPERPDERPVEDGASYVVSGSVENLYASLVVLLGYTDMFKRTDQWQNQARYEFGAGLVCGFRQDAGREGELDLVLQFGTDVSTPVRTLFQGLFESFLARRNVTVSRYVPVTCPNCHSPLSRAVVRDRIRAGRFHTFCNECGKELALPSQDRPTQLTSNEQQAVNSQRRTAFARTDFERSIYQVRSYVEDQKIPRPECFISYAWGEPEHERWVEDRLAADLQKAGVAVLLDRWDNARVGASIPRFISRIEVSQFVIVVGTPLYRQKYENKVSSTGSVVAAEVDIINLRLIGTEAEKETVLPLLLAGDERSSLPTLLRGRVYSDFREESSYFKTALSLVLTLFKMPVSVPAIAGIWASLENARQG